MIARAGRSSAMGHCRVRRVFITIKVRAGHKDASQTINTTAVCAYSKDPKPKYGGPAYAEQLEKKIVRLKFALQTIAPEIDLGQVLEMDMSSPSEEVSQKLLNATKQIPTTASPPSNPPVKASSIEVQELLDTMIEATGRLDIDGKGGCDYLGDFAGLSFLDRISRHCSQLINPDERNEMSLKIFSLQEFGSQMSGLRLSQAEQIKSNLLPSKTVARRLTKVALRDACCLLHFVHQPSFDCSLDRIYETLPETYTMEDQGFLALLYLTLALGELYSKDTLQVGSSTNEIDKMKGCVSFILFLG